MSHAAVMRPVRTHLDLEASENHRLTLVVDLDERGRFRAHVENDKGKSIFDFSNEDEEGAPSEDGLWLVEFGYMRHARDAHGLLEYLQEMGLAGSNASMSVEG